MIIHSQFSISLQISIAVGQHTVICMLQSILNHIDFEERSLRTGLATAQVTYHVGRLELSFLQKAAKSSKIIFLTVGQLRHIDSFHSIRQCQMTHRLLLVADGQHWIFTTESSQVACRTAAVTVRDDGTYLQFGSSFTACLARKAVTSLLFSSSGMRMSFSISLSFSACAAIFVMVFTASTGYFP